MLLEDRQWQSTIDADDSSGYQKFINEHPESRYVHQAQEALKGFRFDGLMVQLVMRKSLRDDSLRTLAPKLKKVIEKALEKEKIPFEWLEPIDATSEPDRNVLAEIDLKEGYGAWIITVDEKLGAPFAPRGHGTDIELHVELIPIRMKPMISEVVKAATRDSVVAQTLHGLHVDAQDDAANKLSRVPVGWGYWVGTEE